MLELLAFGGERLLDLHDQLGLPEDLISVGNDLGTRRLVIGIGETGTRSGIALDHDPVAIVGELPHRRRHQTDPIFAVLDFLRNADQHGGFSDVAARLGNPPAADEF